MSHNSIIPGISGLTVEVRRSLNQIKKNGTPLMPALAPCMPVTTENVVWANLGR